MDKITLVAERKRGALLLQVLLACLLANTVGILLSGPKSPAVFGVAAVL
ncbi:hypothetical protein [Rheinheimera hassiensis]|nr:hypothetical protein [Rheinheimera hassiensis]